MPSDDDRNKTRGNTTKSTTERIQQEIHRLHNFFVGWFTARVDDNDAVFQAGVVNSLHEDFHLVNPQGVITARAPLLEALRGAYGCRQGQVFEIDCQNVRLLQVSGNTYLVSYEEWQTIQRSHTARISSAWFEEDCNNKNNGELIWKYVHETWMPRMGPTSEEEMWTPQA